jgi:hypothetical protein
MTHTKKKPVLVIGERRSGKMLRACRGAGWFGMAHAVHDAHGNAIEKIQPGCFITVEDAHTYKHLWVDRDMRLVEVEVDLDYQEEQCHDNHIFQWWLRQNYPDNPEG